MSLRDRIATTMARGQRRLPKAVLRRRHGAAHEEEGRPAATQPKPQPSAAQLSAAAAARLVQAPATPSGPVHRDIFGRTVAARGSRKRGMRRVM